MLQPSGWPWGWCKVGFIGWGGAFWIKLMLGMRTLHWEVIRVLTRVGQTGGWDWFMVVGQVEGRQNHPMRMEGWRSG